MASDRRGQVRFVDLGYAAKTRPAMVVSATPLDHERALVTLVPHTTSPRGTRFEVASHVRFLKTGVFDAQNLVTAPTAKLIRNLGKLTDQDFDEVLQSVKARLGLKD